MAVYRLDFGWKAPVNPPASGKKVDPASGIRRPGVRAKIPNALVYLPNYEQQVRAIAMRGGTDDEIADAFGVPRELFGKWKEAYPSFCEAIENGRSQADGEVLVALHKKATGGYTLPHTEIVAYRGEIQEVQLVKHFGPDTEACRLWLKHRQHVHWGQDRSQPVRAAGAPSANPGEPRESKAELIAAIVGMIRPKPDNPDGEKRSNRR